MNYILKNISYDRTDPFSMPVILAEMEVVPESNADWRLAHTILCNMRTLKELQELESMLNSRPALPSIKNVYFNNPATVVLWDDGSKTIVRCQDGDTYSKETGLALCLAKKAMGNKSAFNDIFKKWIPEEKKVAHNNKRSKEKKAIIDPCDTCLYSSDACPTCYFHQGKD